MGLPTIFAAAELIRKELEPQKPSKGPPLPQGLGVRWPGYPHHSSLPQLKLPKVDDVIILKSAVTPEEKLLRRMFGREIVEKPELTKEFMCECGKYRRVRYKDVICDRCGMPVIEREVLLLPEGWKISEGRRWYQKYIGR